MPGRLGVRQRLTLLVLLPVAMSVLTVVPFTVTQVDTARSAGATAQQIRDRTHLADLVQTLQDERMLDLAYLTVPGTDRASVVAAQQASIDAADRSGYAAQVTTLAGIGLVGLVTVRQQVLAGAVDPGQVYRAFQETIGALLVAVPLVSQPTSASSGVRQLITIDALLRADEQASGEGAALLVILASPSDGVGLLSASITAGQQELDLLHRTATAAQAAAVDAVDQGTIARRVGLVAGVLNAPAGGGLTVAPDDVLSAVSASATLHRLVEEQVIDAAEAQVSRDARDATATAGAVGGTAFAVLVLVIVLTVRLSQSISTRLRRLTRAVGAVADMAGAELVRVFDDDDQTDPPRLVAVDLRGTDELSELAAGFNRVQGTAVRLLERQMNTRRNVAVMFTNIARRTQHLVGRQLALLDDMERDERDARLLDNLYKLDHIATRLSRSADSLLVIAGTPEEGLASPMSLLDVVRAGTGEIERFQAVRVGRVCDVVVSPRLAGDLRLLLAELLENATAASPPGTSVDVRADLDGDSCLVTIVDHGIGMPAARIAEANRRMVELPRLETAPTRSLGLFVVGRLARRHGLAVLLEPTPGRGVTVTVTVPPTLYSTATGTLPAGLAPPPVDRGMTRATQVLPTALAAAALRAAAELAADPDFDWFGAPLPGAAGELPAGSGMPFGALYRALPELPAAGTPASTTDPAGTPGPAVDAVGTPAPARSGPVAADAPAGFGPVAADAPVSGGHRAGGTEAPPAARGTATVPVLPPRRDADARGDLRRRTPGQFTDVFAGAAAEEFADGPAGGEPPRPRRDPEAEASAAAALEQADRLTEEIIGAAGGRDTVPLTRTGLQRRVPGANLAAGANTAPGDAAAAPAAPRDPAAERDALDGFLTGLARAEHGAAGPDRAGSHPAGPQPAGPDPAGPHPAGPQPAAGPHPAGPDRAAPDQVRADHSAPGRTDRDVLSQETNR